LTEGCQEIHPCIACSSRVKIQFSSQLGQKWLNAGILPEEGPTVRERILVVDDDRATADTMALLVRTLGCEAKAVYGGEAAIDQITNFEPDMALIDIGMLGCDGYETAAGIRQQPGGTHMILVAVTGWSRDEDKRRAYDAGFDLHVTKPMRVETLKDLLALLDPAINSVAIGARS
jgi:CheY-like chemotaxis protein